MRQRRFDGVRDAALLAVLRVAGLRRAELGALDLKGVDPNALMLWVLGKGNKEWLTYVAQARPELEAWLAVRGDAPGPLFFAITKRGGQPARGWGSGLSRMCSGARPSAPACCGGAA